MSVFIRLTAVKRNDIDFAKEILVDVNKIVTPIVENVSGQSIIEVDTDIAYTESYFGNTETYVVSQDLAAIDLLTNEVFFGSVVSQNGRPPINGRALFVKSRIVGTVKDLGGEQSEFDYQVMANSSPENYVVANTLVQINA